MSRVTATALASLGLSVLLSGLKAHGQKIYWTDYSQWKIRRCNVDGSNLEDIVFNQVVQPLGLAFDPELRKIYWVDGESGVRRSAPDGTDIEYVANQGCYPTHVALDPSRGTVYWTVNHCGTGYEIVRSLQHGTQPEIILRRPELVPLGAIAVDPVDQHIYWVEGWLGTPSHVAIFRAAVDGSMEGERLLSVPASDIALDPDGRKLYWTETQDHRIRRANLDGTHLEELVTPVHGHSPSALDLDLATRNMYWTDSLAPGLFRADLDGTRIEPIAVAGGASDGDIALDFATGFVFRSSPSQGRVYRHGYDGTNAKTLVERHAIYPRNLAVHPAAGLMFWTSAGWNVGFGIRRARLDGNLIETIIPIDSIREPLGVALDLRADKIYWLEAIGSNEVKIRRADLRGANVEDVLAAGVPGAGNGSVAGALALNPDGCEIYWAAGVGGIHRSLLDGSDVELLSRDQTGVVRGLVIDEQGRKMYWAATEWPDNAALGSVRRANLDGSDIEQLLSGPFESLSVAIDSAVEMMYWAEECSFLSSIIRRTSLDGLHTEDVVPLGSYYPWTIALDPRTFADFDADRDVDLNDLARLQNCFTGDGPTDVRAECVFFDADPADHDVDAADYAAFGIQFRRP